MLPRHRLRNWCCIGHMLGIVLLLLLFLLPSTTAPCYHLQTHNSKHIICGVFKPPRLWQATYKGHMYAF